MVFEEAFVDLQQHVGGGHKIFPVGSSNDFQNLQIQRLFFSQIKDIQMPLLESTLLNGLIEEELHIAVSSIARNPGYQTPYIFRFTFNQFEESTVMVKDGTSQIAICIIALSRGHDAAEIGINRLAGSRVLAGVDNQMDLRWGLYHKVLPRA